MVNSKAIAWCSWSCGAVLSPCCILVVAIDCSLMSSYSSGCSGRAADDVHGVHDACKEHHRTGVDA